MIQKKLLNFWYQPRSLRHWLFWPLSLPYLLVINLRKRLLSKCWQRPSNAVLIVVGNLSLGGVGKTPLVIALAQQFKKKGLNVGIVSRGYKAAINQFPHELKPEDSAEQVGDEPLLMYEKTQCPVVISPKRNLAVSYLETQHQCDVIISDDGLQHYTMGRDIEIIVIDGKRGLGNHMCLPAGPLREPASRLKQADFIIANEGNWPEAYTMQLKPGTAYSLIDGKTLSLMNNKSIAAVSGIGHPQRFFDSLERLGMAFVAYSFPDHHAFSKEEFRFPEELIIMTEKDAVKCKAFADQNMYCLPVEADLSAAFWQALYQHPSLKAKLK